MSWLTKEERQAIYNGHIAGVNAAILSREYNVGLSTVYRIISCGNKGELDDWPVHIAAERPAIYPAIEKWRVDNRLDLGTLATKLGTSRVSLARWLYETGELKKHYIDQILALTGMTYEEAFRHADH